MKDKVNFSCNIWNVQQILDNPTFQILRPIGLLKGTI